MNPLTLSYEEILKIQKNKYPFLMVDKATEIIPGKFAKGYKNLSANDWFFACHWPGEANMPGMLQVEAMIQMTALAILVMPNKTAGRLYVNTADRLTFKRKVLPGDRLDIEGNILSFTRGIAKCSAQTFVDGNFVSSADFVLVYPEDVAIPLG
jgi:3-hydroxyacyl-[acyl-carrier-protein] dehydratase